MTEELEQFCQRLESEGADRVVVRWIDETRPVEDDDGITVRQVTEATVKSAIDGELVEATFQGIPHRELRRHLEPYDFDVLYRTDNLT
jgi:hypothetical protein